MSHNNDNDDDNGALRCQATTPSWSRDHNKQLLVTQSCADAPGVYGGTRGPQGDVTLTSSVSDDSDDGNWSSASRSSVKSVIGYSHQTAGGIDHRRRRRLRRRFHPYHHNYLISLS